MEELQRLYEGRVVAFNHPTISEDPEQNARWFLQEKVKQSGELPLDLDIICHSRGGLVSRVLAGELGRCPMRPNIQVRRIIFAGTPNHGTDLADREHLVPLHRSGHHAARFGSSRTSQCRLRALRIRALVSQVGGPCRRCRGGRSARRLVHAPARSFSSRVERQLHWIIALLCGHGELRATRRTGQLGPARCGSAGRGPHLSGPPPTTVIVPTNGVFQGGA